MPNVPKISTRNFIITRHSCHIRIYLFYGYHYHRSRTIFPINDYPFYWNGMSFVAFVTFRWFVHLENKWYTDPNIKHLRIVRSVRCLSKSPAARAFSLSFIIFFKHFSAEWLLPPQKVYFVWTRFDISWFLPEPELMSRFKLSVCRDVIDNCFGR